LVSAQPSLNGHPYTQRIRVSPAREAEFLAAFGGEMRCHLRDGSRVVAVLPIRFDDQGNPSDIAWTPSHAERVDNLLFVYEGRPFMYRTGEIVCRAGQTLHLALHHLRLVDRFGNDRLKGP